MIAARFAPDGRAEPFAAPPRAALPKGAWWVPRQVCSETPPAIVRTLEDTPFHVRSDVAVGLLGERVHALHDSLSVPRLDSPLVRLMLPWRMPRRAF